MPPTDPTPAEPSPASAAGPRRVIFPWVWLGVLAAARGALELAPITVDLKTVASMAAAAAGATGVCLWYLLRSRAPWWRRLAVGGAPFLFFYGCNALFEPRFNGSGAIVGLHRRGVAKADQTLADVETETAEGGLADWGPGEYDYPRFLGSGPWAQAVGPPISADWKQNPPEELWRREVGAGWSSFAVLGEYAITQEQRGEQELVVCYRARTGEPVWSHRDSVRFDPQDFAGGMGRQGPRATPTIVGDRVYTQGARGMVNCLDTRTGAALWSVDTEERYGVVIPVWGKSGSPLHVPAADDGVDRDLIVVNVGAPPAEDAEGFDASLVAFDAASGEEVWSVGDKQTSYASPDLVTLHGKRVIVQTSDDILTGHRVADGEELFRMAWSGQSDNMPACSQPIELPGSRLLLTKGYGHGAALVGVKRDGDEWTLEPLWEPPIKRVLQTKFSNAVVRGGYAYAMDGDDLQCVEIATGEAKWSSRRRPKFGFAQVLLVDDYVLVLTEETGEVALIEANPDRYREVAAFRVLAEKETCWNNPVIAGDLLLVRNSVEAAAYRLPIASP